MGGWTGAAPSLSSGCSLGAFPPPAVPAAWPPQSHPFRSFQKLYRSSQSTCPKLNSTDSSRLYLVLRRMTRTPVRPHSRNLEMRASQMAQQVKVLAIKCDNLGSILRRSMVEGENQIPEMYAHTHIYKLKSKYM